jgi:hypothetical protein
LVTSVQVYVCKKEVSDWPWEERRVRNRGNCSRLMRGYTGQCSAAWEIANNRRKGENEGQEDQTNNRWRSRRRRRAWEWAADGGTYIKTQVLINSRDAQAPAPTNGLAAASFRSSKRKAGQQPGGDKIKPTVVARPKLHEDWSWLWPGVRFHGDTC